MRRACRVLVFLFAWNGPSDHPLKISFRCAGDRCDESASRRRLFFLPGGRGRKEADCLCRRRYWLNWCRSARLSPAAREQGPAVPVCCLPVVPVRQLCRSPALSCRIKRGAVHRCGHGCCAGTRALAHCNPALPLPRTTSTHGHALCADLEERVLARRGTSAWRTIFPWKMRLSGCVRQIS